MNPSVLVIDGHHMVHRMFHAMDLKTSKGEPSGVFYGFFRTLNKVVNLFHPNEVIVCFDGPNYTSKKQRYLTHVQYKANRKKEDKPDGFYEQVLDVQKALRFLGIPLIKESFLESDDAIAILAKEFGLTKLVTIVSSDKDLLQLIDANIRVYDDMKTLLQTSSTIEHPKHLIDYKSVVGDPSDNIPGVRGLGKKSVGEFLRTLEEYAQNNGMITTDPREPILTKFFSKSMFRNFLSVKDAEFFQQAVFSSKFAKFFSDTDQVLVLFECLMLVTLPSPLCKTTSDDLMITLKKRRDEAKHRKDLMQFKSLCERWETFTFFAKRSLDSLAALSGGTHATRRIKKRR